MKSVFFLPLALLAAFVTLGDAGCTSKCGKLLGAPMGICSATVNATGPTLYYCIPEPACIEGQMDGYSVAIVNVDESKCPDPNVRFSEDECAKISGGIMCGKYCLVGDVGKHCDELKDILKKVMNEKETDGAFGVQIGSAVLLSTILAVLWAM